MVTSWCRSGNFVDLGRTGGPTRVWREVVNVTIGPPWPSSRSCGGCGATAAPGWPWKFSMPAQPPYCATCRALVGLGRQEHHRRIRRTPDDHHRRAWRIPGPPEGGCLRPRRAPRTDRLGPSQRLSAYEPGGSRHRLPDRATTSRRNNLPKGQQRLVGHPRERRSAGNSTALGEPPRSFRRLRAVSSPGRAETVSCSVVNFLGLDRCQVVDGFVGPLFVEPVDPCRVWISTCSRSRHGPWGPISSVL